MKELPKIMIKGKEYYMDVKLNEIRSVDDTSTSVAFKDLDRDVLDENTGRGIMEVVADYLVSSIIELTSDTSSFLHQKSSTISQQEADNLYLIHRLRVATRDGWCEGAGLAAIQIGEPYRFGWGMYRGKEFVLMNPEIIHSWGEETNKEGCLSIPNTWCAVTRAITIEYVSGGKRRKKYKVSGFMARLVQHEIDHMDGVLITDKKEGNDD